MTKRRILPFFVPHLGCTHQCVFCNQRHITGKGRAVTPEQVRAGLAGCGDPEIEVAFYGGSFTAVPRSVQEELLQAAQGHPIRISTRPDAVGEDALDLLEQYGVKTVELGAQSMDHQVLVLSGRGHTAEDVAVASARIRARGFTLGLQMMTGLPGDTKEKSLCTAQRLVALQPDFVRIYPVVIVRDTPLYELWKSGQYKEHTVDEAVEWCSGIVPLFEGAGITVIRLGLNPTEELSAHDAAGGAYHPAFGELVRSRIVRDALEQRVEEELRSSPLTKEITLSVPQALLSQAIGQHRCNVDYLEARFGLQRVRIVGYNN